MSEDNPDYITLLPGRNGYLVVRMFYSKSMDSYHIKGVVDHTVYKDKSEAVSRAVTIGMERKLEVRF
jgi:hypothetical protein